MPLLPSRLPLVQLCPLLALAQAQLSSMQGAPSPNSLLNDLRAIQFPPGGAAPAAGGTVQAQVSYGGGLSFGGAGLGVGQPQQPPQPQASPGSIFGGQPSGLSGMGGGFGMGAPSGLGAAPLGGGSPFGGLGAAPMGGMGGGGGMPPPQPLGQMSGAGQVAPPGQGGAPPEDMGCAAGAHAAAWASVKQRFRGAVASPLALASREVLVGALEGALQELKAANALDPASADECGLGKLCLQMMSILTVDDPNGLMQIFSAYEQLASPVMTMMLDVPWVLLSQAGWPLFGLLAQINLRKSHAPGAMNTEGLDGLDDPAARMLFEEMGTAVKASNQAGLEAAASAFLQKEPGSGSALAALCALAAQAVAITNVQARVQILDALQSAFKQVIGSAAELDIALSTNWPLWGLTHAAVDSLGVA